MLSGEAMAWPVIETITSPGADPSGLGAAQAGQGPAVKGMRSSSVNVGRIQYSADADIEDQRWSRVDLMLWEISLAGLTINCVSQPKSRDGRRGRRARRVPGHKAGGRGLFRCRGATAAYIVANS